MPNNKLHHLFLKNPPAVNTGFKKTRGFPNEEEEEEDNEPKNYAPQKEDLKEQHRFFNVDRRDRQQKRSLPNLEHIDLIRIQFFVVFNLDLQKKFLQKYGLQVLSYLDFNKTVLFAVENEEQFSTFHGHLELFYQSPSDQEYSGSEYYLIPLIFKFQYLNSGKIIKSFDQNISLIHLIPPINQKVSSIYGSLTTFLSSIEVKYEINDINFTIEAFGLSKENIQRLADNFDIIQTISGTRAGRIRPGRLGTAIRDLGFSIIPDEKAPIVGVIDTGVQNIETLRPILRNFNYDLTSTAALWDESGHGTQVAGIITLGQDFFKARATTYKGKAFITPIKVLNGNEGNFSYKLLAEKIIEAYRNNGIRLFNLSINDAISKQYNSNFSESAYLLDKLSYEYDILIFISVGNQESDDVQALIDEDHISHQYPNHFYCPGTDSPSHSCVFTNLKPPAESLNNISVGAIADNYESGSFSGITPAKELPAYYTRKFHYDYSQIINGSKFLRSQKNSSLVKPDVVFGGGDLLDPDAGLEVFSINPGVPFTKNAGTSFATPFITSIAAEILRHYPDLHTETVKALIINHSNSPCGANPLQFRSSALKGILDKLIGYGLPDSDRILFSKNDEITFAIEDQIKSNEFKVIKLNLPPYLSKREGGNHKLKFKATLTYKFDPIPDNHLCYCPLQISFGIFKPMEVASMANANASVYKIRTSDKWSEDFFGIEKRLISNTQQLSGNLTPEHIDSVSNTLAIAIRCTHKNEVEESYLRSLLTRNHKFSLVITLTELPHERNNSGRLYNELCNLNDLVVINELDADAVADLDS